MTALERYRDTDGVLWCHVHGVPLDAGPCAECHEAARTPAGPDARERAAGMDRDEETDR